MILLHLSLPSREFLFSSPIGTKKKFSREIPHEIWNRGNRSNCLSVTSPRSRQTSTLSHLTGLLYFNLRDVLRAQFFFSSLFLSFFVFLSSDKGIKRTEWNGLWIPARYADRTMLSEHLSQQLSMLNVFQVQKYASFSFERHSSFSFGETILKIPNDNLRKSVV